MPDQPPSFVVLYSSALGCLDGATYLKRNSGDYMEIVNYLLYECLVEPDANG